MFFVDTSLVEPSESLFMCSWLGFAASESCFRVPINFASKLSSYHDLSTTMDTIPNPSVTTRTGRDIRRTKHMEASAQQREQGTEAWDLLYDQDKVETNLAQNDHC